MDYSSTRYPFNASFSIHIALIYTYYTFLYNYDFLRDDFFRVETPSRIIVDVARHRCSILRFQTYCLIRCVIFCSLPLSLSLSLPLVSLSTRTLKQMHSRKALEEANHPTDLLRSPFDYDRL